MTILLIAAVAVGLVLRLRAPGARLSVLGLAGLLMYASLADVAQRADLAPAVFLFGALAGLGVLVDVLRRAA